MCCLLRQACVLAQAHVGCADTAFVPFLRVCPFSGSALSQSLCLYLLEQHRIVAGCLLVLLHVEVCELTEARDVSRDGQASPCHPTDGHTLLLR